MSHCGQLLGSFVALLLLCARASAQIQIGTVKVVTEDPTGARVANAAALLTNPLTGYRQAATTGDGGEAVFNNVPFGRYTLQAEAAGFQTSSRAADVSSNVPVTAVLRLSLAAANETVNVTAGERLIGVNSSRTETVINQNSIGLLPGVNRSRRLQELIATTAGWSAEDNGLLHVRGADDGVLFVVDGVPVAERLDAPSASAFNVDSVESLRVITGDIPAEFGGRSGAVVALQPKSGVDAPLAGSLSLGGASFATRDAAFDVGGGFRQRFGFFVSGAGVASHRFLDPVDPRNFNNRGGAVNFNLRSDWHPTSRDILLVNVGVGGKDFRVPHGEEQEEAGQRQRQELRDGSLSVSWQRVWSARTVTNAAWFRRTYQSRLFGSELDTPVFAEQERRHARQGVIASVTHERGGHHLKFGFDAARLAPREFFTFAVTDSEEAEERDFSDAAIAFTRADPFVFRDRRALGLFAVYAQDSFSPLKHVTLNVGLRYDHSRMLLNEGQLSPRVGVAWHLPRTATVLRASFNRLFQPPQVENLLLSDSEQARRLSPFVDETGGGTPLRAERTSAYEVGFAQAVGGLFRLDVAYWHRTFRHVNDPNVFFGSTLVFPNNVASGWARGVDVRLDVPERKGWSGYVSFTNGRTLQTGPLTGGLFLTEEFIEIGPGARFTPDHDQRNAGAFGVTYRQRRAGLWGAFSGRHQSGFPLEIEDDALDELRDAPGAELVNFERRRVRPFTVFNFSAGAELWRRDRVTVSAQLDVQNVAGGNFAYNFGNPFSGTHFGHPRLWGGRLTISLR
jgi:hypothetical protein